ncbi:MAG: hypothetical protein QUT30_04430 [Acidobacteriota bacterium]|jgi:hypothetical protein|nr:hypothetical protein [Acidobacteriota bacterium]
MEVVGFIFGIIALGTASSALAKIAALEKKLKDAGILDKELKSE